MKSKGITKAGARRRNLVLPEKERMALQGARQFIGEGHSPGRRRFKRNRSSNQEESVFSLKTRDLGLERGNN